MKREQLTELIEDINRKIESMEQSSISTDELDAAYKEGVQSA